MWSLSSSLLASVKCWSRHRLPWVTVLKGKKSCKGSTNLHTGINPFGKSKRKRFLWDGKLIVVPNRNAAGEVQEPAEEMGKKNWKTERERISSTDPNQQGRLHLWRAHRHPILLRLDCFPLDSFRLHVVQLQGLTAALPKFSLLFPIFLLRFHADRSQVKSEAFPTFDWIDSIPCFVTQENANQRRDYRDIWMSASAGYFLLVVLNNSTRDKLLISVSDKSLCKTTILWNGCNSYPCKSFEYIRLFSFSQTMSASPEQASPSICWERKVLLEDAVSRQRYNVPWAWSGGAGNHVLRDWEDCVSNTIDSLSSSVSLRPTMIIIIIFFFASFPCFDFVVGSWREALNGSVVFFLMSRYIFVSHFSFLTIDRK